MHSKPGLWAEVSAAYILANKSAPYYCYAIGSGISQISINVLYMHDSGTQLHPHTGLPTNLSDFLDVCEGEFVGTVEQ